MFKPHMAQGLSEPLWVRQDRSRPTGIPREYPQSSTSIHTFYNEPHGTTFSSFSTLEFSFFLFPFAFPSSQCPAFHGHSRRICASPGVCRFPGAAHRRHEFIQAPSS